ncbi:hypothetical protein ABBQ38_011181 [Trebouxia sp. C0009 RCD-2024]
MRSWSRSCWVQRRGPGGCKSLSKGPILLGRGDQEAQAVLMWLSPVWACAHTDSPPSDVAQGQPPMSPSLTWKELRGRAAASPHKQRQSLP